MNRRNILKGAGLITAGAAVGVLSPINKDVNVTATMGGVAVPVPGNELNLKPSTSERDYRWNRTKNLLKEKGVNGVVIPSICFGQLPAFADQLTNASAMKAGAVVFPLDGSPRTWGNFTMPFDGSWVKPDSDENLLTLVEFISKSIKELGLENRKIATVGVDESEFGYHEFNGNGYMPYPVWRDVLKAFPDTEFVDITAEFAEMIIVRSPEDATLHRQAALIGEGLHEYILSFVKVGMSDREFKANVDYYLALNGATPDVKALMIMPGLIKEGQVINSEYGIHYNGGYTQSTLCFCMGEPSNSVRERRDVAIASLNKAMDMIKPGVTFGSVIDAIGKIVKDAGYWNMFPQVHGLNTISLVGEIGNNSNQFQPIRGADIVLQEGMVLSLENGAISGPIPLNQVKVGGAGVVTATGFEMWNSKGLDLQIIPVA